MSASEITAPTSSLRRTGYATWLTVDTAAGLSSGIQNFALPLVTLLITGSPVMAGVAAAATVVARATANLIGGVLADRYDRSRMLVIGCITATVLSALFTLLAVGRGLTVVTVIAAALVLACATALFAMVREPMLRDILPADLVGRAQASNQARDAALSLATGPLGGVLLGIGTGFVGAAMMVCDLVATIGAVVLFRRRRPIAHERHARATEEPRGQLREAFGWLVHRRDMVSLLAIVTVINLGISIAMTTTVYALAQSGTSTQTIGFVSAAVGVGMLLGSATAMWVIKHVPGGVTTVIALAVTTAALGMLPLVDSPVGIAVLLFIVGLVMPAVNATLGGYLMLATPSDMLGRVTAASSALGGVVAPLAPLIAGVGLGALGRSHTIMIGSALMVTAVVITVCSRAVRGIPTDAHWQRHGESFSAPDQRSRSRGSRRPTP